ncbi:hypothetical protein [Dysosmobacter segnis]|uniref:CYTH domain-containing protein n=1 Tax=Dysosmobacter segnis TaxID=2763042 RepID=A0A923MM87_9FIRM|nr:hypothetical protein [Dysosmobacter segnis]MBC5772346.1 hypothetical protein [Dysosmobacter segnis]
MTSLRRLNISLEDGADGTVQQEIEYAFFARVESWEWLEQATRQEKQEQWESYRERGEGAFAQCRVRATDDKTYEMCVKTKTPGELGKKEVEQICSKDFFEQFRFFADKGLNKTRYIFEIEGTDLKWEVDVYTTQSGERHPWLKIDLEVPSAETELPKFPFPLKEVIVNQPAQRSEEEKAQISKLFEEWTIKVEAVKAEPAEATAE